MKKKYWRYLTIAMITLSIIFFVFSFMPLSPAMDLPARTLSAEPVDIKLSGAIKRATIKEIDPNDIDQSQEKLTHFYYIGYIWPKSGCYLQTALNERTSMYGFQISVGKHGSPSEPLYIGMMTTMNNPLNGPYYAVSVIFPSAIPTDDQLYWIGIEHDPYDGKTVHLVCISTDDPYDDDYWMMGAGDRSPYPTAKAWWNWEEEKWYYDAEDDKDMCFRTYTEGGSGDGELPVIAISMTTWIIRVSGFSFLILGVVSGVKYYTVI